MTTLSASSTSQILTPVAGLTVGNVLPLQEGSHSLLMKICVKHSDSKCLRWHVNVTVLPAAAEPCFAAEAPYLGVLDNLDRDRLGKRRSWGFFGHSVLCCSILCHSRSAVQSRASLPAPSAWRCQPIHWLFIWMFSSSLLTQRLEKEPNSAPVKGSRRLLCEGIHPGDILHHVFIWTARNVVAVWHYLLLCSHSAQLARLCHCNFK